MLSMIDKLQTYDYSCMAINDTTFTAHAAMKKMSVAEPTEEGRRCKRAA